MPLVRLHETFSPLILVVDDDADSREMYALTLRRVGFRVEEAVNGAIGLAKAVALEPDAILLDHLMPVMDGCEMARRLREDARTRGTPVVMLTGFGTATTSGRELRAEGVCDAYLLKPCDLDDVIATLRTVLCSATPCVAASPAPTHGLFGPR